MSERNPWIPDPTREAIETAALLRFASRAAAVVTAVAVVAIACLVV